MNKARSVLLTELKDLLNIKGSSDFWTDTQLNRYLNRAYKKYQRVWLRKKPQWAKYEEDFTYTASAEYVDVAPTGTAWNLDYIENRTSSQPGTKIPIVQTKQDIQRRYSVNDGSVGGGSPKAFVEYVQSVASGVYTNTLRVYMAPIPKSSLSCRLHFQTVNADFSADTHTTGLPDSVEECILYEAGIQARIQEEAPTQDLRTSLQVAEKEMLADSKGLDRGHARVNFDPRNLI